MLKTCFSGNFIFVLVHLEFVFYYYYFFFISYLTTCDILLISVKPYYTYHKTLYRLWGNIYGFLNMVTWIISRALRKIKRRERERERERERKKEKHIGIEESAI